MNSTARKIVIGVGIIAAIGALASGIYLFYKRQIALALQYAYKISKVKLYHIRKDSFSFELFVKIMNKSDFSLVINGYDLDVIMNGRKIANVASNKQYKIYPTNTSEISLMIDFDPSQVFDKNYLSELLSYAVVDQSKLKLQITGALNISMDFINLKKLKFDYQTTLAQIINSKPNENVKSESV